MEALEGLEDLVGLVLGRRNIPAGMVRPGSRLTSRGAGAGPQARTAMEAMHRGLQAEQAVMEAEELVGSIRSGAMVQNFKQSPPEVLEVEVVTRALSHLAEPAATMAVALAVQRLALISPPRPYLVRQA